MGENPPGVKSSGITPSTLVVTALVFVAAGVACAIWTVHPYGRKFDLIDLAVYRAAAKAVVHHKSVFGEYVASQLRVRLPFIYPPVAAVVFIPFLWFGTTVANVAWTLVTIASLGIVVRIFFAPLLERFSNARVLTFVLALLAVAAVSPVEDHLRFGQIGIPLMACCVVDCCVERPRWPRGLFIGLATAVKLVPGIFIPYLFLTRRTRAGFTAIATFVVLTLLGFAAAPSDSWKFWTDKMFEPTSPKYFTNQSLEGLLQRALGPWRIFWLLAVAAVVVFGLWRAMLASRAGNELLGVAIVGLVGVLASPISWIHHLVWIVPVIAVLAGDARDKRRFVLACLVAAFFVARVPYIGNDELHGTGFVAAMFEDAYGFACVALLAYLTDVVPVTRAALKDRSAARSRPKPSVAPR